MISWRTFWLSLGALVGVPILFFVGYGVAAIVTIAPIFLKGH